MKEHLLRLIAALRPKKLDGVSFAEAEEKSLITLAKAALSETISQHKENMKLIQALQEAMQAVDSGEPSKVKEAIQKAIDVYNDMVSKMGETGPMDGGKATKEGKDKSGDEERSNVIDLRKRQEDLEKKLTESEKRDHDLRVQLCESTLRAELAESKLPDPSKTRLTEKFSGKIFEKAELSKEIDSEKKYCARMMESLHPHGLRIETGQDSTDKMGDAVEGMIAGFDINKTPRFRSFTEAYSRMEGLSPFTPGIKERLWHGLKEAAPIYNRKKAFREAITTASFAEVLGDRLHKRMVAEYAEIGLEEWRKIVAITEASDFLTNRATRLGGYGTNMPTVAEAGAYTALTSPTDEEATWLLAKRGGLETLSWESIVNDNLKALQLIPKRLGRGCKNTLFQFVFEFINPAVNPVIYDGVTLYHATHGANLRTVALSWAEFNNHVIVMLEQAAYNEANFFPGFKPKYICVPAELYITAYEISTATKSTSAARTETVDNAYSQFGLEVIALPYWTDVNNWSLVGNPKILPGIEIGFLDGKQDPEILQEVANSGSDFTNDQIRYKVRHIYGGAVTDFRPFTGAVVP